MSTKRHKKPNRNTKLHKVRLEAAMRLHEALRLMGYTVNLKPVRGVNLRLIEAA